ncbi:glycosyltransferase family 9 protein [Marinomonas algarum]|uniref:Glycosyltransferase family 9 protein n=1 Tax=Marinomonas algarum TaxID=2883105 RepID=A0A9X1IMR6_9GAMM|nr:glycosyltransferase family 9 protein [Marinomonas algarum]MCB5160613.1 glycosyltransferase family 9 protein [Marinomonas algarum]
MQQEKMQHIAVLRLSALGDVCHAVAVVQALMRKYPSAKITWITAPLEAKLVRMVEGVEVIEYDKKSGFSGMFALRAALQHITFDALLHLQWSLRSSVLMRMINAKRRIGFSLSRSREKQHWFVNEQAPEPRGPHVLDSFLSIASVLGVEEVQFPCPLNLPEAEFDLPKPYVVVNPCGSKIAKNWTLEGNREVVQRLLDRGYTPVLTGGPSSLEIEFSGQIEKGLKGVVNLVGKTSVEAMCRLIQGAHLVVSPDTGPAHIATLVGTPVLGLYALSNPDRTGPYKDLANVVSVYDVLVEKEYGKKQEALPWATTVHDPDAMKHIEIETVLSKLDTLI